MGGRVRRRFAMRRPPVSGSATFSSSSSRPARRPSRGGSSARRSRRVDRGRTWNAWFRASRETAELRAETEQTGGSLAKLVLDLDLLDTRAIDMLPTLAPVTLPAAYALAARASRCRIEAALTAYSGRGSRTRCSPRSSWCRSASSGTAAAARAGRDDSDGRRDCDRRSKMTDLSTFAPGLCLASARHETQYSRLFRS